MTYFRNLSGFIIFLFSLIVFFSSCDSDQHNDRSSVTEATIQPATLVASPTDTPAAKPSPAKPANLESETGKPLTGILRERGDFWIGLPNEKGSMLYLRLAANTEIQVLNQIEDYYEVAHRGIIGYLEKRFVNVLEEESTAKAYVVTSPVPEGDSTADTAATSLSGPNTPATTEGETAPATNTNACTGAIGQEILPGVSCVQYRSKVYEKVSTLENYIQRIIDKAELNRQKSVDLACQLFVNEQARVYTSSLNEAGRSRPVRKYLNGLMMLSYDRVEIEWTNIQYVSELRKGPDGRYFGYVHIEQKFEGFMDGRLVYGDITEKKITIVLEAYEIIDAVGDSSMRWDVFLSDIGVEQTQTL